MNRNLLAATTLPLVIASHAAANGYVELALAPLAGDPVFEHAARPGQYDHYGTATGSFTGTGTLTPGLYELIAKSWCTDWAYNDTAESWSDLEFELDLGAVDNTAFHDSASTILCSWNQDWYGWGDDQDAQTGLSSWAADVISYPVVGVVTGSMSFDFENTIDGRRAFMASFDNDIDVRGYGSDAGASGFGVGDLSLVFEVLTETTFELDADFRIRVPAPAGVVPIGLLYVISAGTRRR